MVIVCLGLILNIGAGVSQGFILGPLLFLIYISDLANDIKSKCQLLAVDTSLFSVVYDIDTSANDLNRDLENEWAFQWKTKFNSGPTKQAQKIIFNRKKLFLINQLSIFLTLQ